MAIKDCIRKMEKAGAPLSPDQISAIEGFLDIGMTDAQAVRAVSLQAHQNVVDIANRARNEGADLAPVTNPVTKLVQFQTKALQKISDRQDEINTELGTLTDTFSDIASIESYVRSRHTPSGIAMDVVDGDYVWVDLANDKQVLDVMVQLTFRPDTKDAREALGLMGASAVEMFDSFRAMQADKPAVVDQIHVLAKELEQLDKRVSVIFHGKPQTFYQSEGPRLMVTHNLTSENLGFVDKLGGFAMPSVSVTQEGGVMTGFGEITMIGTEDLGDPKQLPLFDADGYTVRFPDPKYKKPKAADRDALWQEFLPYTLIWEDKSNLGYMLDQGLIDHVNPTAVIWNMTDNNAVKAKFLQEVYGEDLTPQKSDVKPHYQWGWDDELVEFFEKEDLRGLNHEWEDPRRHALLKRAAVIVERVAKRSIAERMNRPVTHEKVQRTWELAGLVNRDGEISETKLFQLQRDAGRKDTKEIDFLSTTSMLNARIDIDNRKLEFKQWVEGKILPMIGEPRLRIGNKWVPYNLENIVRKMKGKLVGTEFMAGQLNEGLMRALASIRFKSIEEMRLRSGVAMSDKEEVDILRAASQAKMNAWIGQVAQFYVHVNEQGWVDHFEADNDARQAIVRLATSRGVFTAIEFDAELKRKGFEDVPHWLVDEGMDAAMTWLAVPVPYFEGKPQRAVMLEEFAGAVIPSDASPEVRATLAKRGIRFKEYQVGDNIDELQTRTDAVTEFTQQLNNQGERTLFQSEIGFTSGLLTAARTMPQEKGPAQQMLATLKKQPNVKKQELEWLGVEEWMDAQQEVMPSVLDKKTTSIDINGKQIHLLQNPSEAGLRRFRQGIKREYAEQGWSTTANPLTRETFDAAGNRWVWESSDAMHTTMESAIQAEFGARTLNQNQPRISAPVITRDELIEFIEAGGVQVKESLYAGEEHRDPQLQFDPREAPEDTVDPELGPDESVQWFDVSDLQNIFGETYTVYVDKDAGNAGARVDSTGEWLDIPGLIQHQDQENIVIAIEEHIGRRSRVPGAIAAAKWSSYTMPGGENHREVVLHLPEIGGYNFKLEDLKEVGYQAAANVTRDEENRQNETFWFIDAYSPMPDTVGTETKRVQTFQILKSSMPTIEQAMQYIVDNKPVEGPANMNAGSHAYPQQNIMAWMRLTDRAGPNGERILFVEEVQSDIHQEGQKKGYRLSDKDRQKLQDRIDANWGKASDQMKAMGNLGFNTAFDGLNFVRNQADWKRLKNVAPTAETNFIEEWDAAARDLDEKSGGQVPDMPFKGDAWGELAMKRVIRLAAEGGYDQIAWTTGDQQNARWSLAMVYDKIEWDPRNGALLTYDEDGQMLQSEHSSLEDLHTYIGAERVLEIKKQMDETMRRYDIVTAKSVDLDQDDAFVNPRDNYLLDDGYVLISQNGEIERHHGGDYMIFETEEAARNGQEDLSYANNIPTLSGMDLEVGGEGMRNFYDKILRNVTNKAARRLDKKAKVKPFGGEITIGQDVNIRYIYRHDMANDKWIVEDASGNDNASYDNRADAVAATARLNGQKQVVVHAMDITPDMKAAALEGQTLFQDRNRASITFDATNKAIIRMSESKDLSSFLHETAHLYLEMMGDLSEAADATESIINDYQKMLEYLGVNSRREITRDHHELLARSFEAYLREGNAPTAELAPLFTEIKGWMIRIYRQLSRLLGPGEQLTDEIRGVFDRMVATDSQIAASEDYMGYVALYANAEEMGVTQRTFEVYRSLMDESHDEAVDHETKKILKAMLWGQQQWWKSELAKLSDEVRAEAEKAPVYQALAMLQKGKLPDGSDTPIAPFKLSRDDLLSRYGKDFMKRLPRPFVYSAKGGVDVDVAANIFGFSSGNELIQALVQAPRMEDYIKAEAKRRMQERHPDPLSSPEQADEATRAVHNEKRGRILAMELKRLRAAVAADRKIVAATKKDAKEQDKQARDANKGQLPKREDYAHIKAAAKKIIEAKRIRDVDPNVWLQAERKAGRLAFEAMGRKDYETAYAEKRKQIMNYEAYRAAVRAKAQAARDQKYLNRFNSSGKKRSKLRERMGKAGVLEQIDAVLAGINFRKISGAQIDRETVNAEMLVAIEQGIADGTLVVPQSVLATLKTPGGVNWQELTFEEFAGIRDVVKQLEHQAKTQLAIIINGEKVIIQEAVDDVVASIVANHDAVVVPLGEGGFGRKLSKSVREGVGHWLRSSSIARILDQSGFGAVTRRIIVPIRRAYTEKLYPRLQQASEELAQIYKKHYSNAELSRLTKPIEDLLNEKMSKSDILALALNWGSESNRQAVLGGIRKDAQGNKTPAFTEQDVAMLLAKLDARDWAFVQDMWDYQDSYYPEMAETEKRRRGIAPEKIEALAFEITTSDGQTITVRGGYHPLQYNREHGGRTTANEFEDYFNRVTNGTYVSANTRAGATYERVKNHGKVVLLSLNTIDRNLRELIRDITIGDEINLVRRILTDEQVTTAASGTKNNELIKELGLWLSDAAVGELPAQSFWEKGLSWVRVGFTKSKLAFNIYVVGLQITGVFQSMAVIGSGNYARGVGKFITNPAGNYKMVMERSAFMDARYGILQTWDKDVQDTNNFLQSMFGPAPTKLKGAFDTMGHYYFYPIAKMQSVVDVTTWMGAYEKGLNEENLSEDNAVLYADTQVEAAQTSGLFSDRSGIERGTLGSRNRQSQFVRLWTTLISYMLAKGNIAYEKGVAFKKKPSAEELVYLLTDYILLFMIEGIASSLIYRNWPGDDDEDEGVIGWTAKVTLDSMLSGIPLVREYSQAKYGSGNTPIGALVVDSYKFIEQFKQGDADEAAVKVGIKVAGTLFHLPASQPNRAVEALMSDDDVAIYEYLIGKRDK